MAGVEPALTRLMDAASIKSSRVMDRHTGAAAGGISGSVLTVPDHKVRTIKKAWSE